VGPFCGYEWPSRWEFAGGDRSSRIGGDMKVVIGKIWFLWGVLLCALMAYSFISVASDYEFDMDSAVGRVVSLFSLGRDGPLLSFAGVGRPGNLLLIACATEFLAFSILPVIVVAFVRSIITGEWRSVHSQSAPAATPATAALRAHRARALSAPRVAFCVFIVFLSTSDWISRAFMSSHPVYAKTPFELAFRVMAIAVSPAAFALMTWFAVIFCCRALARKTA
jgi:hypothetical protein